MNDRIPTFSDEHERRFRGMVRQRGLRGAFAAGVLIVAIAASSGLLDGWLLGAAIMALAIMAFLLPGRDRGRPFHAQARRFAEPVHSMADALLANIPDPVILVDRRSIVLEANAAARTLLPALKIRHPLSFALRSPVVLDAIEHVFQAGAARSVEYTERIPTERAFEVQITTLKAEAPGSGEMGVMLFFHDLTTARRLEAMRVDFIANASHELRTPLASLLGFIETLQGPARNDPSAHDRFLEIMRGQAQRMTRLIEDLLSLSRIEMHAHLPPQGSVDLVALVSHMTEVLSPLARERGVEVRAALPLEPLWIQGDRDELLRLAENLIENAVKYGESGGRVDVTLTRAPAEGAAGQVELAVRDYGPGVAAEHMPRLTERFYRVDVVQSRDKGGTGLGLAIVKHIVNRHKGQLLIESEPGAGATFRVTLPEGGGAQSLTG